MQNTVFTIPIGRQCKSFAIRSYWIINGWGCRRIYLFKVIPGVSNISVNRIIKTLRLPATRHCNVRPCLIIKINRKKIKRSRSRLSHHIKFPLSIQREIILRQFKIPFQCFCQVVIRNKHSVRLQSVHLKDIRLTIPLIVRLQLRIGWQKGDLKQ